MNQFKGSKNVFSQFLLSFLHHKSSSNLLTQTIRVKIRILMLIPASSMFLTTNLKNWNLKSTIQRILISTIISKKSNQIKIKLKLTKFQNHKYHHIQTKIKTKLRLSIRLIQAQTKLILTRPANKIKNQLKSKSSLSWNPKVSELSYCFKAPTNNYPIWSLYPDDSLR